MTTRTRLVVLGLALGVMVCAVGLVLLVLLRPLAVFESMERAGLRWRGLQRLEVGGPRGPQVYWKAGNGAALVFLHGANDQAGTWVRVIRPIQTGHRLVLVDLAGHGESAPRDGPLTVRDLLDGIEAVVNAEAPGRRVTFVGNSLGGWLALVYARQHRDRVAHVVLVNGAAVRGDGSEAAVNLLPRNRDEARQAVAATMSPESPGMPSFVLDDLVRRAPTSPLARLQRAPPADEFSLDEHLREIETPVTLIWGADDKVLPLAYAERVAGQLPLARLTSISRCGHVPQRECPEALERELELALDRPPPTR